MVTQSLVEQGKVLCPAQVCRPEARHNEADLFEERCQGGSSLFLCSTNEEGCVMEYLSATALIIGFVVIFGTILEEILFGEEE